MRINGAPVQLPLRLGRDDPKIKWECIVGVCLRWKAKRAVYICSSDFVGTPKTSCMKYRYLTKYCPPCYTQEAGDVRRGPGETGCPQPHCPFLGKEGGSCQMRLFLANQLSPFVGQLLYSVFYYFWISVLSIKELVSHSCLPSIVIRCRQLHCVPSQIFDMPVSSIRSIYRCPRPTCRALRHPVSTT